MYSKKQRIAAMIGIILLCGLYLVTLVCAIFNFDGTGRLFQACLFASIAVPLLLWIYIWLYGKMTDKHTIADFDTAEQRKLRQEAEKEAAGQTDGDAQTVTISKRSKSKK